MWKCASQGQYILLLVLILPDYDVKKDKNGALLI